MFYCKKDKQSLLTGEISKEKESQNSEKENKKKDVLKIIKGMKFESNMVNLQTTKSWIKRPLQSLQATMGRLGNWQDAPRNRSTELQFECSLKVIFETTVKFFY